MEELNGEFDGLVELTEEELEAVVGGVASAVHPNSTPSD